MTDDASAERLAFLSAAGELLSSSLDYRQTLQHVARLAVPALGDMCIVDVMEGSQLRRVATSHVRTSKAELLEDLSRHRPLIEGSRTPAARVLASGETEWIEQVTPELVTTHTEGSEHARLVEAIGVRSLVAAPMKARGTTVGVISVGITESDRIYGPEDVALAEELARRAALAVDNAKLYRTARMELDRRRQAEDDLRRSEQRFRAIMEQSPLSTQILAPDGTTVGVNDAWKALWGATLEDLAGYSVFNDPQLDAAGITPMLRRAFQGESVELPDVRYEPAKTLPNRIHGDLRWVRAFAYPVMDESGAVEEVVLLHEDVTARRHAAQMLQASEDRLQRALSISRINVWDWDLKTNLVTCSENAREFWGIDVGQAEDFFEVVHPDDHAKVKESTRLAIEQGGAYESVFRLCLPGNAIRWVKSRGSIEFDAAGRAVRLLGMTLDITQQKRAEDATRMLADAGEALGASLDYQATLVNLAQVVIPTLADWYAVDLVTAGGELERVSVSHPDPEKVAKAWELHRRYPPQRDAPRGAWAVMETGEADWAEVITPEQLEQVAQDPEHLELLRALNLKSYVRVPLTARGTTIGLLTLVFAESERRYSEVDVGLAQDLARRAAVAVDNARLYQQLQLADARKDEFLAMLAHELRNPLAPISTAAQLLRIAPEDSGRVIGASEIISRQVGHMTELVDDLLDVSRVTRGLVELEREPVDLKSVVASAVEQVQSLMEAKEHALTTSISPATLIVEGDGARLIQVVANLLNNAAKYTAPGGTVDLRADAVGTQVRLTVKDSGVGIDESLLPHVFELFTQGERTVDRSQGGLGIGLALVKRIVELHGGTVSVHSAGRSCGSAFTVSIPRARHQALPADSNQSAIAKETGPSRILVVDDNVDAVNVLADVLRLEGHQVFVACTAGEAIALAERETGLQVYVLDIGLPDMSGYELAMQLRRRSKATGAIYVALTGYGQEQDRQRSSEAGFDHHLVKPADVQRLLAIVSRSGGSLG